MTPCSINPQSNRTCEHGTPGCEIHHTDGVPNQFPTMRHRETSYHVDILMTATEPSAMRPMVVYRGQVSGANSVMDADVFHELFEPVR